MSVETGGVDISEVPVTSTLGEEVAHACMSHMKFIEHEVLAWLIPSGEPSDAPHALALNWKR